MFLTKDNLDDDCGDVGRLFQRNCPLYFNVCLTKWELQKVLGQVDIFIQKHTGLISVGLTLTNDKSCCVF